MLFDFAQSAELAQRILDFASTSAESRSLSSSMTALRLQDLCAYSACEWLSESAHRWRSHMVTHRGYPGMLAGA